MDSPPSVPSKRLTIRPEWRDNRLSLVASVKPNLTESDASKPAMEQSPLTLQARPDILEPKVVHLYRRLFRELEDDEKSEGFWRELFLLRPDLSQLHTILENTDAEFLLHMQHQPQQLVLQAIAGIKAGQGPADEHALETLTVFFAVVLAKKYTNPSSDIIEVLAGLDNVDGVFTELVGTLDQVIKDGRTFIIRQKAVRTAIAVVSGGYHTALVSYFIHRDFFPALMKIVQQLEEPLEASEPLLLTGLLANYNKFEVHNQYRVRFSDFVNDKVMMQIVESMSLTCKILRERYIAVQDDGINGWSIGGTLSYVGLGALTRAKPASSSLTEEQQRELFLAQPRLEAATLLTLYDFAAANKMLCHHFITQPAPAKESATPFSNFISFTSYLYQHAYRNWRASLYARLTLVIFLILVEDAGLAKLLCNTHEPVRLCRQRPPYLPLPKKERPYAAAIIDVLIDGINHNLRKKLDLTFYSQSIAVLSRLVAQLGKSHTKLLYHWPELWRSLLSFVRFLTTYADELKTMVGINQLVQAFVDFLALAMTTGEAFLHDAAAYDDLLYKLVESGEALIKLRDTYNLSKPGDDSSHINALIGVSKHYHELIDSQGSKKEHLSPQEVNKIIKQGYETLSIKTMESLEQIEPYREVEHKTELKRICRVVVADAVALVTYKESGL